MEDKGALAMQIGMKVLDIPLGKQEIGRKKELERGLRRVEKGIWKYVEGWILKPDSYASTWDKIGPIIGCWRWNISH